MSSGKESHNYTRIPLEDVSIDPDNTTNEIPSTPPPEFEAVGSNLNPERRQASDLEVDILYLYRRINELTDTLASVRANAGGVDPENLTQNRPNLKFLFMYFSGLLIFGVGLYFLLMYLVKM
ncbi:hypothetical protein DFJ63DRAFT_336995 [Scheffersomyces coipomensis]|uniref:uncharacterized protein n=1 Tax=Scheffersomyces coipomensis TaxID=1788519 RepID=UPI00315DE8E5